MLREGAGRPAARSRVLGLRPGSHRGRRRRQKRGKIRCKDGHKDHLLPYSPTALLPSKPSFSHSCLLPTWWFWRGGCTRSHSEHGRETPQRRWYFVSRRGRVGRCQVCQMHECFLNLLFAIPAVNNGSRAAKAAQSIRTSSPDDWQKSQTMVTRGGAAR